LRDLYIKKSLLGSGWVVWRGNPDEDDGWAVFNATAEKWCFTRRAAEKHARRLLEAHNQRAEKVEL
jgi:hypothetical protein